MEENQRASEPRKLRKIKRPRPVDPVTGAYGMPSKINAPLNEHPIDFIGSSGEAENIHMVSEEDMQYAQGNIADYLHNKTVLLLLGIAMIFGVIVGSMFMPKVSSNVEKRTLDGIVFNSDVPSGRGRCGLTEPHQGCVLYIMNPKNQEVVGKDFYTTAAKWTGRERYIIETGNMHYGNVRIKPGYIAQINVPPLSY